MEKTLWITGLGETMRPDFLKEAVQYPYGKALFLDRKSTRLNSSHIQKTRMPSSA